MKARLLLLLVICAGAASLMVGCGVSDSPAVATVGDEEITIEDFDRFIPSTNRVFQSAQDEFDKKRLLLDSLIVTRLLVQEAQRRGIDKDPSIAEAVAANRQQFLLEAMYQIEITDKVSVTDAEVRDYYNKLEYLIRASRIMVMEEDTADALFERIKAGEDFSQLAYEYSLDPRAKHNRGDLGYFSYGSGDPALEDVAFQMEPGEVSPPIKGSQVWHIIKVVDKIPNEKRRSFQEMRPTIERNILGVKRMALLQKFYDSVLTKYPVEIDETVADYVMHKRSELYPPQMLANIPKNDFDMDQLDRNERELVLGTWEGGQLTLLEYLVQARRMLQPQQRADFDDYAGLARSCQDVMMQQILTLEAEKRGIDQTDEYKWRVKMFKEYSAADIMRNDSLPQPEPPTETEQREYYDSHREDFVVPARIHIYEIMVSDEMQARRLAREIKSIEQFRKQAEQLTERSGLRAKRGNMGFIERSWSRELFDAAWAVPDSTVGGPVRVFDKYSIVFPVAREDKVYGEFLEVKETIRDEMFQATKDSMFVDWVEKQKAAVGVEISEDMIWETIDREAYADLGTESGNQ